MDTSHKSQCELYTRTNQIACWKCKIVSTLIWRHVRLLCSLFSQMFYGLLLTITDVTCTA